MNLKAFALLLIASLACAQVSQPYAHPNSEITSPTNASPPEVKPKEVNPDDPVITINGFCPDQAQPDNQCKTIITRAQFEKLTEALEPGMSLPLRLKVANSYAEMMQLAAAAEKSGLDKTPAFAEEMRYARLQLLSQDFTRKLKQDAAQISDADLADYYKKNQSSFEEATVARVFVPHTKQRAHNDPETSASVDAASQAKADEDAMTQLALELRARAATGEDPDKLQAEAYAAAGIGEIAPHTKMEMVRRSALVPQHEKVFELKPGEVSQVFSDPGGAHFIYIMLDKRMPSLEDVSNEIRTQISTQRFRDGMRSFEGNAVFSDAYFNPPRPSTMPPRRNPHRNKETVNSNQDNK
jgi:hypothetical protein